MSENANLSEAERQMVLVTWNDTFAEFPHDVCLHQLFDEQVARTPQAVAVRFAERSLTFQALQERANQLAHLLQKRGVEPGVLVGISMERSLEMIVSLLGVLKAGGAYVPLDPHYPQERLAFMIEDTNVQLLLTQAHVVDNLPSLQAEVILLDTAWAELAEESTDTPNVAVTAEDVCYVVYTSGSTGMPKGVLGLHRGAVNRLHWMWDKYPFTAGDVCCQKTSLNFVDSVWEIWGALLRGVSLVLIPDAVLKDTPTFIAALAEHQVSRLVLVPSLLRVMLETYPDLQDRLPALRLWVCSGESLSVELVEMFRAVMPDALLLNLYGMSEVAADSTFFEASAVDGEYRSIPIGRPIANTQVYILDAQMELVPIGEEGELYIGGAGLSGGYLNRPELTAERFVTNPFVQGELLYRTGDIGRYLPDGNIEYLGRVDDQVKIRGYRIELPEVEAALRTIAGVKQVLVTAREDVPGNKRLVAYLVVEQAASVTFAELQAFLQRKLPEYMVPSAFVLLDAFPLLPNGKVDKRSFPAPDDHDGALVERYVAPRTEVEEIMAGIWAQVLGVERVGVYDNFFARGGQSLIATQIVSRVRDAFAVELPMMALFEAPTVAALTERMQALRAKRQVGDLGHEGSVAMREKVGKRRERSSDEEHHMGNLDQMEHGSLMHNDASVVHSQGAQSQVELEQLTVWNDTTVSRGALDEMCIHQLVEAQVERTPERVALVFAGQVMTYRELNERANQVAHHLQKRGVTAETLVGLCMERSLEMVVGMLGILKSGGAYVPLDPDLPQERLAYLLDDTQVSIVLTLERLRSRLQGQFEGDVLALDADWQTFAQEERENVASDVTADQLAYVIYTSGSTGKPKGVMVPHRGVCNRLLWMLETYPLSAEDVFLQKTPFGFDVSVYEFFSPLLLGARLVIAQPGGHQDPSYLVNVIAEQHVSVVHFVPSMLSVFLEARSLERCDQLRMVICSGEALPWDLQERFFARMGADVTLHNFYGPTEASIEVAAWDCPRDSELQVVPIGRPIANCQLHILDEKRQPVPIGVAGELYIGGIGVARGYWKRPELTETAFLPDPFRTEQGARLYKTGDVAQYLPNGAIQYLGRVDSQVKIRGFRIELGEIEVALTAHPAVREAVVVVAEEGTGLKRLVAYFVSENEATPASAELRAHMKDRLPEYMVPAAFVKLDAMPLSVNGKVDRKALPAPDWSLIERESVFVAPRTPLEEVLGMIWEEVLGTLQVGVRDNFFALGGYSLLGIQVMARILEAFEIDLPLHHLFDAPTVEGLAEVMLAEEGQRVRIERTAEVLLRILRMSDEEVDAMLMSRNGG